MKESEEKDRQGSVMQGERRTEPVQPGAARRTRRLASVLMAALLLPGAALGEWADGRYQDMGEGFRGPLVATVTIRAGMIETVTAESRGDTPDEYLQTALDGLAPRIVQQNGMEGVEAVSGATGSSRGILQAVEGVLTQAAASFLPDDSAMGGPLAGAAQGGDGASGTADGSSNATEAPGVTPRPTRDPASAELFSGLGSTTNFRVGPGKDAEGGQVYSFNVVMASVLFDKNDRIVDARVDIYEVSTPNYDGVTMPHFSGWPGTPGLPVADENGGIMGASENTEDTAKQELSTWVTKRDRGDAYGMNPRNEWYRQMNAYEQWMIGQTTAELRAWFARNTSVKTGRPLKADSDDAEDQNLLKAMSDEERGALEDVVSMATMSLSDSHGLILEAVEEAFEKRKPVDYGS